jgi:hypothetical protein
MRGGGCEVETATIYINTGITSRFGVIGDMEQRM